MRPGSRIFVPVYRRADEQKPAGKAPVIEDRAAEILRLAPRRRNRRRRCDRRRWGRLDRCGWRRRLLSARREKRHGNHDDSHRRTTEQPVTGHCFGHGDHPLLLALSCSFTGPNLTAILAEEFKLRVVLGGRGRDVTRMWLNRGARPVSIAGLHRLSRSGPKCPDAARL